MLIIVILSVRLSTVDSWNCIMMLERLISPFMRALCFQVDLFWPTLMGPSQIIPCQPFSVTPVSLAVLFFRQLLGTERQIKTAKITFKILGGS